MSRTDERAPDALRGILFEVDWVPHAEGSCLVTMGGTRVLCTASVEEGLPRWRQGSEDGWVTAEYAMLPRATHTRTGRERGGARGRTQEIQRLIGRSLRAVVDFRMLGPRTVTVDCDVLHADGGTRTAAITGGWIALFQACNGLLSSGAIERHPLTGGVAAVSVGLVDGHPLLDLDYGEDVRADVDLNLVATHDGRLVEVQGTAEGSPFSREEMDRMIELGLAGVSELARAQRRALQDAVGLNGIAGA